MIGSLWEGGGRPSETKRRQSRRLPAQEPPQKPPGSDFGTSRASFGRFLSAFWEPLGPDFQAFSVLSKDVTPAAIVSLKCWVGGPALALTICDDFPVRVLLRHSPAASQSAAKPAAPGAGPGVPSAAHSPGVPSAAHSPGLRVFVRLTIMSKFA